MTTTLRPSGPEHTDERGGRARTFAICVNGREVGGVRVKAFGDGSGLVADLFVAEEGRGRGRGTTAVLAAEELLRVWGCTSTRTDILDDLGGDRAGSSPLRLLRWAESLGYSLEARNMVKELPTTPPALPAGAETRPMTAAEFPAWLEREAAGYARLLVERSGLTSEQAAAKSAADHAGIAERGLDTPGISVTHLVVAGEAVGTVWVETLNSPEPLARLDSPAWVFDVQVEEACRGRGHGRTLMLVAEGVAIEAGRPRLGLNVHAGNVAAERLYESLGYRTYRWSLAKSL
ncbi:GNAT superfamily N-acetyltransferase [Streptacidiphilus sp. MAP12-20]|uniref:GNAT family N-acetyltransferase n=1 Tax=Streptacidiphilus sp. MAP12-20 TaxID=3156299 RepID=UPI003519D1A1